MEEQQHKEALLAYHALLLRAAASGSPALPGAGLTAAALQERCEAALRRDFNALDVELDVRGPLRRLLDGGAVVAAPPAEGAGPATVYCAVPLADAVQVWALLLSYFLDEPGR